MALVMTVCLVGLAALAYVRHLSWVADELVEQMESMSPDEVTTALEKAAELDERGLPVLVAALSSRSEHVVLAAKQVLLELIDRWELLTADATAARLTRLAELLAARANQFDDRGRRAAATIASRILRWPAHAAAEDRETLIAACAKVLRASREDVLPKARVAVTNPTPERIRAAQENPAVANRTEPLAAELSLDGLAPLPGGGFPLGAPATARANTRASIARDDRDSPAGGGLRDRSAPEGDGGQTGQGQRRLPPVPVQIGGPVANHVGGSADPLLRFRRDELANDESDSHEGPLGHPAYDTFDLMRMLRDPDASKVSWAEGQLATQGFDESHLELARRLTDPDVEMRRVWASRLPGIQGIDAQSWLLWLVEDEAADVRLTAITLLATSSSDPKVLDQIAAVARRDRDERIRRQAERILAERNRR